MSVSAAKARAITGGLSEPSKMPGKAFGFSASRCITGSKLREVEGSVCSNCYACKGFYVFKKAKLAHSRRFAKLRSALASPTARAQWVTAMATMINRMREPYFRWHDSGDLQSIDHLRMIAEVARLTPTVTHWLPTREYRMVRAFLASDGCPENLVIRLSAHMRNQVLPVEGTPTSAVYDNLKDAPGYHCPARSQGNQCGSCRACWDRTVPLVTYPAH